MHHRLDGDFSSGQHSPPFEQLAPDDFLVPSLNCHPKFPATTKTSKKEKAEKAKKHFARAAHFSVHFFTVTARLQFFVLKWTQTSQDQIFFLFLTMDMAVRNSATEEFAFIDKVNKLE